MYLKCTGKQWWEIRKQVLIRDGHCCQFEKLGLDPLPTCTPDQPETRRRKLTVHHILPRINGGSHDMDNLITLCAAHHMKVHPHMIAELKGGFSGEFEFILPEL